MEKETMRYIEGLLEKQTVDITNAVAEALKIAQEEEVNRLKELNESLKSEKMLLEKEAEELRLSVQMTEALRVETAKKYYEAQDELSLLKEQLEKAEASLKEAQEERNFVKEKLSHYEERYGKMEAAYITYQDLSEDVRLRLKNICGLGGIYDFAASGCEWNKIEGMWGFAKTRIIEYKDEDAKRLVRIFKFMFEAFRECKGDDFELISPACGERFDSDKHSILGVKTDGKIDEVLLDGIKHNGTVKAKAIVTVI